MAGIGATTQAARLHAAGDPLRIGVTQIGERPGDAARLVIDRLASLGHEPIPIRLSEMGFRDGQVHAAGAALGRIDAVLLRGGAATDDAALSVLETTAASGIPVLNHPRAVRIVRDKWETAQELVAADAPHPMTMPISLGSERADAAAVMARLDETTGMAGSLVVKPTRDMGGTGVTFLNMADPRATDADRLASANSIALVMHDLVRGSNATVDVAQGARLLGRVPASEQAGAMRAALAAADPGLPLELRGPSGHQVVLHPTGAPAAAHRQSLDGVSDLLLATDRRDRLVAQEWMREGTGRDIRAYVVRDHGGTPRIAGAIERRAADGFAQANYSAGGTVHAARLTDDQAETAIRVADRMGLDYSGVDFIDGPRGPVIVEVNSSPGMMPDANDPITGGIWPKYVEMVVGAARRAQAGGSGAG